MSRARRSAAAIVDNFARYHEEYVMRGAGHPDLMEWQAERYAVARERLIRYLMGVEHEGLQMPPEPEVEY